MTGLVLVNPPARHRHGAPDNVWIETGGGGHTEPVNVGAVGRCECGKYLLRIRGLRYDRWAPISDREARRRLKRSGATQ